MTNECTRFLTIWRDAPRIRLSFLVLACLLLTPIASEAAKLPPRFQAYATTDVGDGMNCVVGATARSGETSDERAYVYLEEARSHKLQWITPIPVHAGWYQNRASHCAADAKTVYALLQTDTNRVPVMSQTLISVVALDKLSGQIKANDPVKVGDTPGAHTVFVYEGAENFRSNAGKVVVIGEYASKDDPAETRKPFEAMVPAQK